MRGVQEHSATNRHASRDQLGRRRVGAPLTPAENHGRLFGSEGPPGDDEEGEERSRVRAGAAQTRCEQAVLVSGHVLRARERFEPKRRAGCSCSPPLQRRSVKTGREREQQFRRGVLVERDPAPTA